MRHGEELRRGRYQGSDSIAKRWNGHKWSAIAPRKQGSISFLSAVDCPSATSCFAVGRYKAGTKIRALIEHWNGAAWTILPAAAAGGSTTQTLNGVSCPTTTSCFAVGNHEEPGDQVGGPLVERWDGTTWTTQHAPTPKYEKFRGLPVTPLLTSVSCAVPNNCMAAGYAPEHSLIERWNGSSWSILPSPQFGNGVLAELRSVSCASAADCSAVGAKLATIDAREGVPLRNSINVHWNGASWKVLPKPGAVPTNTAAFEVGQLAELNGVSCPTKTRCAAVGNSAQPERWNGSKWSLAPYASTSSFSALLAVSCPATTTCLAVGTAYPPLEAAQDVLAERWDGTHWAVVPSVTPSGTNVYAVLTSISCAGETDCTAVGRFTKVPAGDSSSSAGAVLVERWNGTGWTKVSVPVPAPKTTDAGLNAVSCTGATNCLAVGQYTTTSGNNGPVFHMLSERWNGTSWSKVAMPGPAAGQWNGIACPSPTNCIAVGFDGSTHAQSRAVERNELGPRHTRRGRHVSHVRLVHQRHRLHRGR